MVNPSVRLTPFDSLLSGLLKGFPPHPGSIRHTLAFPQVNSYRAIRPGHNLPSASLRVRIFADKFRNHWVRSFFD